MRWRDEAEFKESEHPRAANGQFGKGGSGGASLKGDVHSAAEEISSMGLQNIKGAESWQEMQNSLDPEDQHALEKYFDSPEEAFEALKEYEAPGAGGPSSKPESKPQLTAHEKALSAPVTGSVGERNELRKLIKTAKGDMKVALTKKLIQSYEIKLKKTEKKGDQAKVAELKSKIAALHSSIGSKTSVPSAPQAQEQPKLPPAVQAVSQAAQYSAAEAKAFDDLKAMAGEGSAKHYVSQVKKKIEQNWPSLRQDTGMTPAEAAHVYAYTTSDHYNRINSALRKGQYTEQDWKHVAALNDALDKLPSHNDSVVYRKVGKYEVAEFYAPGMVVEERAFMSTTKNTDVGGKVVFKIKTKSERSSAKSIENLSHYGPGTGNNEKEVLFKSGTRFRVTKNTKGGFGHEIELEEV